jgi:hypothetical protein
MQPTDQSHSPQNDPPEHAPPRRTVAATSVPPMPGYAPGSTPANGMRVAVSKRILWVGTAAYPLATIVRVGTTVIVPRHGAAVRRFLKFAAIVVLAAVVIYVLGSITSSGGGGDGEQQSSGAGWVFVVAPIIVIGYFVLDTLPVLTQTRLFAVAIDTAGPPTALVAWKQPEAANELANAVTDAIENPQLEFSKVVHNMVVDLRQYRFGDNVNIYGGQGNTGVSK